METGLADRPTAPPGLSPSPPSARVPPHAPSCRSDGRFSFGTAPPPAARATRFLSLARSSNQLSIRPAVLAPRRRRCTGLREAPRSAPLPAPSSVAPGRSDPQRALLRGHLFGRCLSFARVRRRNPIPFTITLFFSVSTQGSSHEWEGDERGGARRRSKVEGKVGRELSTEEVEGNGGRELGTEEVEGNGGHGLVERIKGGVRPPSRSERDRRPWRGQRSSGSFSRPLPLGTVRSGLTASGPGQAWAGRCLRRPESWPFPRRPRVLPRRESRRRVRRKARRRRRGCPRRGAP